MPVGNAAMSIGYYNNTIYMIGGTASDGKGLLNYHLEDDSFSYAQFL